MAYGSWIGGFIGYMFGGSLGALAGIILGGLVDLVTGGSGRTARIGNGWDDDENANGNFSQRPPVNERGSFLFSLLVLTAESRSCCASLTNRNGRVPTASVKPCSSVAARWRWA